MTGAFFNALGILFGGLLGLALRRPMALSLQIFLRSALGASTVFSGLCLVWSSVSGSFLSALKEICVAVLAVTIGSLLGKLLGLQKLSNHLGRYAGRIINAGQTGAPRKVSDGFKACAVLFCAAPLGLIGAVADGLSGYFYLHGVVRLSSPLVPRRYHDALPVLRETMAGIAWLDRFSQHRRRSDCLRRGCGDF